MPVALVTGCSSGLGEAIAAGFARNGYQVVATMRRPETASALLKALAAERPTEFTIAALDVTRAEQRKQAIDLCVQRFGRLDVLVNNAGITTEGSLEDTPESVWRTLFETNFFGPLELMRLALPVMRNQGGGRIINVTSVAALVTTPLLSAYSASKHALDSASEALDIEARSFGVRVVSVLPGPFKTELNAKSVALNASKPYADIAARFKAAFDPLREKAPTDLSPVVNTAFAAAGDSNPQVRYTVGTDAIKALPGVVAALEPLHKFALHLTGQA